MYIITNTDHYFHNTLLIKRDIKKYMCPLSLDLTPKNVNKKSITVFYSSVILGVSLTDPHNYTLYFLLNIN